MAETKEKEVKVTKHANIHAALSAFQGELKPMEKSGHVEFSTTSGTVKFDYTPLGDIMKAIYPLLAKHGLAVRHEISKEGVEAILTHESYKERDAIATKVVKVVEQTMHREGQPDMAAPAQQTKETSDQFDYVRQVDGEIRSGIVKIKEGAQMKDTGAAITYARRYTLTMVLGISSEDDKDAELLEASGKNAIAYAFDRAQKGINEAKTIAELEKAVNLLKKDKAALEGGKPGALGLSLEQYDELLEMADVRRGDLE